MASSWMLRVAAAARNRRWITTTSHMVRPHPTTFRISSFSSGTGDDDGKDGRGSRNKKNDDPFGLSESDDVVLPPALKRDPTTGKLLLEETGSELTPQQKRLLSMSQEERHAHYLEKFEQESGGQKDGDVLDSEERRDLLGKQLLDEEKALNVLGRRPSIVEGETSRPLSSEEMRATESFVKKDSGNDAKFDEGSFRETTLFDGAQEAAKDWEGSNPDLDVSWMAGGKGDEQLEDLLPSDFAPTRLVNRKQAKRIPRHILHHNNLPLLRRYMSPSGAIMPRSQTRLGAKDQRKIAKLIKRARCLGLIPFIGQFKVENNGWIHERDIEDNRDWEEELERRGLVTAKQKRRAELVKQSPPPQSPPSQK